MDRDDVIEGIRHHKREMDALIEELGNNALISDAQVCAFEMTSQNLEYLLEEGV